MVCVNLRCFDLEHFSCDLFQQLRAGHRRHARRIHSRVEFDDVRADDVGLERAERGREVPARDRIAAEPAGIYTLSLHDALPILDHVQRLSS